MSVYSVVKSVVELSVNFGAGMVTTNIVNAFKPDNLSKFKKVAFGIGAFGISMVVSDKVSEGIGQQMDEIAAPFMKTEKKKAPEDIKWEAVTEYMKQDVELTASIYRQIQNSSDN